MRVFSGIQPSGRPHLGNYLGALRNWVEDQHEADSFFSVVDLHAITVEQNPAELHQATLELFATLLAVGLDPQVSTIFAQSQVPEHAGLAWLMECTATYGELSRMTQFKDKGRGSESVKAGLFTYPALMAADILLYHADRVPVGEDQKQHLELTRDLAIRFNRLYGKVFTVPEPAIPRIGARVMDLQHPQAKMSKSTASPLGIIYVQDSADDVRKKIAKAVTDTENTVAYDPENKPGVSNLLEIFSALNGATPSEIAAHYDSYGKLKVDLTEALNATLGPVREKIDLYLKDTAELEGAMRLGAEKAQSVAAPTLHAAKAAMGFVRA